MQKNNFHKEPGPDVLFTRFLQRQTHEPTDVQVQKWEDEGGAIPDPEDGADNAADQGRPFATRVKAYLSRAWKAMNSNYNPLEKKNVQ